MRSENDCMFSVIMPAYNAEKTCIRAINSVLSNVCSSYELIIVDDGSRDVTLSICQKLADENPIIKVLHQENKGVSAARNYAITCAQGRYICFLDSDDALVDGALDELQELVVRNDYPDFVLFGYHSLSNNVISDTWIPEEEVRLDMVINQMLTSRVGLNTLWTKLIKKSLLVEDFNTSKNMGEDLEFICAYLTRIKRFQIVRKPFYLYTLDNENSLTKKRELLVHSMADDMKIRTELASFYDLSTVVVQEKLFEQTEGILRSCKDNSDFGRIRETLCNDVTYQQMIREYEPVRRKNKLLKCLLVNNMWSVMRAYFFCKDIAVRFRKSTGNNRKF